MDTESSYIFCLQQNSNSISRLRANGKSCLVSLKSPKLHSASPSVEVQGELQSSRLALGFPRAHSLNPVVSVSGSSLNTLTEFGDSKWADLSSAMSALRHNSHPTQLMSPNAGITVKLWHHHGQGNDSFINFDLIRRGKLKHYMRERTAEWWYICSQMHQWLPSAFISPFSYCPRCHHSSTAQSTPLNASSKVRIAWAWKREKKAGHRYCMHSIQTLVH